MKKLFLQFLLLTSAFVAVSVGCAKDPVDDGGRSSKFTLGVISAGSVEIIAETKSAIRYAYSVTTDLEATAPDAAILFSGDNVTGELKDGTNTINITGLTPETKFRIFIGAEYSVNNIVTLGNVTTLTTTETGAFTGFVTFIPSSEHGIMRFWINVPENVTLGYNYIDAAEYDTFIDMFGRVPADFIEGNQDIVNVITESQMIEFTHWGDPENPEESGYRSLRPGQSIQFIVGELEKSNELDDIGRTVYDAKFDFEGYYDTEMGTDQEPFWDNPEYHYMERANVRPANIHPEELVDIKMVNLTVNTAYIQITPDESVTNYAYVVMPVSWWNETSEKYGEGATMYFAQDFSEFATEPKSITTSLLPFVEYRLTTFVKMNENATLLSVSNLDFTAIEPTKPAPLVVVTPIKDPSGIVNPWKVWFNIKSTSKDVKLMRYVLNYSRDWQLVLNDNFGYLDMLDTYGANISDPASISAIISPAGLNIQFDSWYDMESIIAVQLFNDEQHSNNPDIQVEGEKSVCSSWSDNIEDAPKVESTLFEDLKGDWTIESKLYVSAGGGKWAQEETASKTGVTISDKIEYPATLTADHYAIYESVGVNKEGADKLFVDFKISADKFNAATIGQNRLVCLGLDFGRTYTKFESAFDLFVHELYSKAVTPADCVYDFGPKWYLEIADGDVVTLPIDPFKVLPLSNWGDNIGLFALSTDPYSFHPENPKEFTVTVSDDKNTITINPIVSKGVTYTLSAGVNNYGQIIPDFIASEVVLTRGKYTEEVGPTYVPTYKAMSGAKVVSKSYKMTYFDTTRDAKVKYSDSKISVDDFLARSKALLK